MMIAPVKRTALLAATALALAGCNMAPRYVRPDLPVPPLAPTGPAYPANPGVGDTLVPADTAWGDFFTDPRLRQVIGMALANNRDLRVALANVEQARAQYRVQRADLLPTVAASGSATYQKSPFGAAGSGRLDIYSASIGVSAWEIDLFGRTRNLTQAAQEQFFAARENRAAAQTALVAEIATAWLTLAADQERLRIVRDTEAAFRQTRDIVAGRYQAGIASELELRQAGTSLDQARADIAQATTQVAQDRNALDLLAGTPLAAELLPDALAPEGATLDQLPAGLSSTSLLRRPDIAAAEHQLIAANADIGAARAAFFPTISLTAALGSMSLGLSGLFKGPAENWSVVPSASLPIFDAGRNAGNLRYAKATRDAMLGQYERTVQTAFREVADALARRGTIDDQFAAQVSLEDNARGAWQLSEARFKAGVEPFLNTLDSQRSHYAAQQSLVATRLVRATNAVELYRALGGGLK